MDDTLATNMEPHISHSLNSGKRGYMEDSTGESYRAY